MDNSELLLGRPFGGCAILYRKCLALCTSSLETCSNCFCAVKFCDSTCFTYLLISIYMPADSGLSSYTEYLNTSGELEGFDCDNVFVIGDFNVDFDRSSSRSKLLCEFMSNLCVVSCDLSFCDEVIVLYWIPMALISSLYTLLTCALACFPTRSVSTTRRRLVGWTQSVNESSMFWYKIWEGSGLFIFWCLITNREM